MPKRPNPEKGQRSQNFRDQLRGEQDGERAEQEHRERISQAVASLQSCAGYATPGIAIHILPGESPALQEERAGAADPLVANEEFCDAWVRKCWIPSIEAVLAVVKPEIVEQFDPLVSEGEPGAGVVRVALRAVHSFYSRLMRDPETVEAVIQDLADLRQELGQNRYLIQQVFMQLAAYLGRATRPSQLTPTLFPVLSEDAATIRDILLERGPKDAVTGPRICEIFAARTKRGIDEADFRTRIVPLLKRWGLKNEPKLGYFFPEDAPARRR